MNGSLGRDRTLGRVDVTRQGDVTVLTLNGAPVNAMTHDLVRGLGVAVDGVSRDGTRAVVIRSSTSGFFCAGADLKFVHQADEAKFSEYLSEVRATVEAVADLPMPTVAAIDGLALGGGMELALACDLRWMSASARMGLPEVKLGLLPGAGGTQRLTRAVGPNRAAELMLSGRRLSAAEASAWGLAQVAEGAADDAALAWTEQYLKGSALAGEAILRCVAAATETSFETGMRVELDEIGRLFAGDEARSLIARFIDTTTAR
jgi:enoyl-CoA hydratase/carnithine racemase